jgi:hypothetical protein
MAESEHLLFVSHITAVKGLKFRLASLQVGNQVLTDVVASVMPSDSATPLSELSFQSWSIDNKSGTLKLAPIGDKPAVGAAAARAARGRTERDTGGRARRGAADAGAANGGSEPGRGDPGGGDRAQARGRGAALRTCRDRRLCRQGNGRSRGSVGGNGADSSRCDPGVPRPYGLRQCPLEPAGARLRPGTAAAKQLRPLFGGAATS